MKKTIKLGLYQARIKMAKDFQGHILPVITMPKVFHENQKKLAKWVKNWVNHYER